MHLFTLLSNAHGPLDIQLNFPLFSIILGFIGVVICSLSNRKVARVVTLIIEAMVATMNLLLVFYMHNYEPGFYEFAMGHYNAPFGNEIRIGAIEALLASVFSFVMMGCVLGGDKHLKRDVPEAKINYFYVLFNLILVALVALIYTNDVFTGYVFLEIATLASVGITMIRDQGRSIVAAVRYMIFNLLGSGLFLIGITLLYDWTGYLSMTYINKEVTEVVANGTMQPLVIITFALVTVGLAIKSGLFPFHFWMPDTYGSSTTAAKGVLSGLISKGYIILLIKMIFRTFGLENVKSTQLLTVLFVLGVAGMIVGSLNAIKQKNINKMIAFSSAAQIGYIYMGIGLGTEYGLIAAFFHILVHAITKPLIFISASRLEDASKSREFSDLKGAGYRDKLAGVLFTLGSLSMVGFPITAGFISKISFATSALESNSFMMYATLFALIISTILNAVYFIHTVITIYSRNEEKIDYKPVRDIPFAISGIMLIAVNILFGVIPATILHVMNHGIENFF